MSMFNFYQDNFDSEIFKKRVYKLILDGEPANFDLVLDDLKKYHPDIVFCFTAFIPEIISLLQQNQFLLASIRSTYYLEGKNKISVIPQLPENLKLIQNSVDKPVIAIEDIKRMAYIIGEKSHYFNDASISSQQAEAIYSAWIYNSFYNNYVKESFLIMDNNYLVGLITIKIDEQKYGIIDLIGIDSSFQNQGLGKFLLFQAIDYCTKHNVVKIKVVTEGENVPANIFYQKNGFVLEDVKLVYHKHYL